MEPYFIDSVMIAVYCVTLMSCIALRHHSKDICIVISRNKLIVYVFNNILTLLLNKVSRFTAFKL